MTDRQDPSAPRVLGQSALTASPLAWGMWRFKGESVDDAQALVETALDTGLTLLDTADIYGVDTPQGFGSAEALLGQVLRQAPSLRARMVLASKGGIVLGVPYDSSAAYLTQACEASLRRLGVEHIDLYQVHRPDSLAHPAETADALTRLREAGKIGEVGVSNYAPSQVSALQAHLDFPLASIQPEFSALAIEPLSDGVLDQALQHGLGVLAWSPLAGGRLGGGDDRAQAVIAALDVVAETHGVSRAAAAYAWIIAHPARPIPIIGSQKVERIREAAQALTVRFTRAQWYAVLTASRGVALP
ncbi:aldo/keto reductase family oxidoreductase [Caulobacter sp. RHG1]|uniref:aldo/keto reductase n=1 Tax=Caulobacter sp. (strain RHG1) TaxID=2545762 RepID=UPI001556746E|nr:aldo/keto reductase [Caulobacter sp. RHG1]NQE61364.1 Oxidoreductase, aldo/keto reductase family [Caulobacter sp. RHG1]